MRKFIYMLIFCISNSASAGIDKKELSSWQLINGTFYINTNDFQVIDKKLNFWVRNKSYKKRRLTIDCKNLIERESFNSIFTEWQPVFKNTPKYEIAKQLCFLSKISGFTMEKKRKQPSWAKRIIKMSSQNFSKVRDKEPKSIMSISPENSLPPVKELTKEKKIQFTFD